ncbi:CDP-glycerol glycerophosphotransferase family protein [Demequina litorisediminis]|uniref:CDP-glycerol glycerophosphotransferase family protein n=1 Tax=Demequina litorisediminis TaxID=1849022 RepID=UPI0024E09999|nr:CDP-glycerol glycerophosphotransferase family protein [Demequina litorisediminis]
MARDAGAEIVVLPHPNLEAYLDEKAFPAHVRLASYARDDFQELVAEAGMVITDYSSNAFEAAIAGRAVLYYQFDRDNFYAGGHVYRKGYFDYEADGFGPVATDLDGALAEIAALAATGFSRPDLYEERARAAFAACDGTSCAKVVEAIEAGIVGRAGRRTSTNDK